MRVLLLLGAIVLPAVAGLVYLALSRWVTAARLVSLGVALGAHACAWLVFWDAYRGVAEPWRSFEPDLLRATLLGAAEVGILLSAVRASTLSRRRDAVAVPALAVATSAVAVCAYSGSLAVQALVLAVPTLAAAVAALSGSGRRDARGLIGLAATDVVALVGLSLVYDATGTAILGIAPGAGVGILLAASALKAGAIPWVATWRLSSSGGPGAPISAAIRGHGLLLAAIAGLAMYDGPPPTGMAVTASVAALLGGIAAVASRDHRAALSSAAAASFAMPWFALGLGGAVGVRAFLLLAPLVPVAAGLAFLLGWREREADVRTVVVEDAPDVPPEEAPVDEPEVVEPPADDEVAAEDPDAVRRRLRVLERRGLLPPSDAGGDGEPRTGADVGDTPASEADAPEADADAPPPTLQPATAAEARSEEILAPTGGRWLSAAALGVVLGSLVGVPPGSGFPGTWLALSLGATRSQLGPWWLLATGAAAAGLALALIGSVRAVRAARGGIPTAIVGAIGALGLIYAGGQPIRLGLGWWIRVESGLGLPEVLPAAGAPGLPAVGGANLLLAAAPALVLTVALAALALLRPRRVRAGAPAPTAARGVAPRALVAARTRSVAIGRAMSRTLRPLGDAVGRARALGFGFALAAALEGVALLFAGRLVYLAARGGFL